MSKSYPRNVLMVIVNYYMADECTRLIQSIYSSSPRSLKQIVCVDNSCDELELAQLKKLQSNLQQHNASANDILLDVRHNSANIGFGAAINAVVEQQLTESPLLERVLLINPDVELNSDSIEKLIDGSLECSDAGVWGGVTLNNVDEADGFHAWREPTMMREIAWSLGLAKLFPIKDFVNDYSQQHRYFANLSHYPVDVVSGCFLLIDAKLWSKLNGFDERFFLYSEEVDLCLRARLLEASPHIINAAKIKHARGTASHDLARMKLLVNSKLLYWQKHHGNLKKRLMHFLYAFGYLWRGCVFFFIAQRRVQASSLIKLSIALLSKKTLVNNKNEFAE